MLRGNGIAGVIPVALLPLAGALTGFLGARLLSIADPFLGSSLGALLVLALWSAAWGMRQENGVASSIGLVTLVFLLLIRWQAMMRLPSSPFLELAACLALGRGAMVTIGYTTRPAEGLSDRWKGIEAAFAALSAVALALLPGLLLGLVLLGAAVFATLLLRNWYSTRLGGVDDASLEASSFAVESWLIVLAGCRNCPWWS